MTARITREDRLNSREFVEQAVPATSRALRRAYESYFARLGLTLTQALLIGHLDVTDQHTLNQTELAARIGLRKAATGTAIDGLIGRGLLRRASDPKDRRAKLVGLTPSGSEVARAVDRAFGELAAALRRGVSSEQRRMVVDTLLEMRSNLRALDGEDLDWDASFLVMESSTDSDDARSGVV